MCILNFIRNLWIPSVIKKEINALHDNTIKCLWNEIYDKIYIIGETRTKEELIIRFPLKRVYEIDGYWKKYDYKTIDFGFYTLNVNDNINYTYKDIEIKLDFYSDNDIGFLELCRTT